MQTPRAIVRSITENALKVYYVHILAYKNTACSPNKTPTAQYN